MMLHFENVLFAIVVDLQSGRPGGHFGLGGLFLRHKGRAGSCLCDLNARQAGFLKLESKCKFQKYVFQFFFVFTFCAFRLSAL